MTCMHVTIICNLSSSQVHNSFGRMTQASMIFILFYQTMSEANHRLLFYEINEINKHNHKMK